MPFDPYLEWLHIPADRRPPTHYDLLGLPAFEEDPQRISAAAMGQIAFVRTYEKGPLGEHATEVLVDLHKALDCLRDPQRKRSYDQELRSRETTGLEGESVGDAPTSFPGSLVMIGQEAEERATEPPDDAVQLLPRDPWAWPVAPIPVTLVEAPPKRSWIWDAPLPPGIDADQLDQSVVDESSASRLIGAVLAVGFVAVLLISFGIPWPLVLLLAVVVVVLILRTFPSDGHPGTSVKEDSMNPEEIVENAIAELARRFPGAIRGATAGRERREYRGVVDAVRSVGRLHECHCGMNDPARNWAAPESIATIHGKTWSVGYDTKSNIISCGDKGYHSTRYANTPPCG